MRNLCFFVIAAVLSLAGMPRYAAAQTIKLPLNHSIQQSAAGSLNLLRADLDRDGQGDIFCVVDNPEGDAYIVAVTSTRGRMESGIVPACCGSIEKGAKPGVVRIASKGMRGFAYYSFRWDASAKDFRLIGYDTESFGNAANEGSGKSSLNLLTGDFEAAFNTYDEKREELVALPKVRKKVAIGKRVYLQKFGEESEAWVSELAHRNFPREVQ